jgi:prepilin-type N-terminal cleavage/methylation domain-containing protein/prepilin-type processing-associated H-X9-DG protein
MDFPAKAVMIQIKNRLMRTRPNVQQVAGRNSAGQRRGFTILELMAVLAIILVVVGLLSSALNQARTRTFRITCLNNMRQLQVAWDLYAHENGDYLVLNKTEETGTTLSATRKSSTNSWVAGNPKEDRTTENLRKGSLFYIVQNPAVYRCPMDSSSTRSGTLRTRSYSISAYLGGDNDDLDPRVKMKTSELVNPPPEKVFVFIEEHEDSIWDGGFLVLPRERFSLNGGTWSSTPADRHMQGCNLTFADGHIEYWKWSAPKRANLNNQMITNPGDLRDLRRLQESVPKP